MPNRGAIWSQLWAQSPGHWQHYLPWRPPRLNRGSICSERGGLCLDVSRSAPAAQLHSWPTAFIRVDGSTTRTRGCVHDPLHASRVQRHAHWARLTSTACAVCKSHVCQSHAHAIEIRAPTDTLCVC
jgi:hypothetical protein